MAALGAQESCSSTFRCTYDVFLSFRGKDTRKNFTDNLYAALLDAGIHTFRDDDEIPRGENIDTELEKAIQQSRISIIVFSKDYASSRWCLEELVKILQHKKNSKHKILPIFYDVNPSQVRKQTGSYAKAFFRHEQRCKTENDEKKEELVDRVRKWREALRKAADLPAMELKNQADGDESKFIQNIIKEVQSKLSSVALTVVPYPTGIDYRVRSINFWTEESPNATGIVAICGMGGIGKTTIARIVYNINIVKFQVGSFLANIRATLKEPNGLIRLQKQLLSDLLKGKGEKI